MPFRGSSCDHRRVNRPGLVVLLVVLVSVGISASTAAAVREASPAVSYTDGAGDTPGPLDVTAVSLEQKGTDLRLRIRTAGAWAPQDLSPSGGRSLCVVFSVPKRTTPRARVCAAGTSAAPVLRYSELGAAGGAKPELPLDASVSRPDPRTLVATFAPEAAGIAVGRYAWHVASSWTDDASCAAFSCNDAVPDRATAPALSRLYAGPACFGAAARVPGRPCQNRRLARTVTPTPEDALLAPNAPCFSERTAQGLNVCRFRTERRDATEEVALIGDSHAAHWRAGLNVVTSARGWRGVSITRTSCPFSAARPVTTPRALRNCTTFKRRVVQWLRDRPKVRTVFLSSNTGAVVVPRGKDKLEHKIAGYAAALRWLPKSVTRVVVLRDVPRNGPSTPLCVERALRLRRRMRSACAVPRRRARTRDPLAIAAARSSSARVRVVDMTPFFCSKRFCFPVVGGVLVHKDEAHLTDVFATTLGPFLLPRVNAALRR